MIAPNTAIDMLETKLWVGNKRLPGALGNVVMAHEENSFVDSGLRKKEMREDRQVKHWKEGWTEEVGIKICSRNIETLQKGKNVENSTNNKFLIEHARECIEATKGKKEDRNKINTVRKNKGVWLPHEVLED